MRATRATTLVAAVTAAALAGCDGPPRSSQVSGGGGGGGQATAAASAAPATPEDEARGIYRDRCAVCHGAQGGGDGPAGMALTPRPRSFRDAAWQAATTDEQIERVIAEGGAAVGKSAAMPANADIAARRPVLAALRAHLRTFRP